MSDSMNLPPAPGHMRYAVYPCGWKIGLCDQPSPPMAVFADRDQASAFGSRMWPSTFEIVDLDEYRP